jgi:hypothetical protein
MKRLMGLLTLAAIVMPMAGCVVYPAPRPELRPAPAYACVWVPDHYDAYGKFIPGHCKR